uniref:Uncharacterized protein n=1 Tax=Pararge aegeria TaxID=116150 RepID=S4PIN5_9NEOP
MWWRCDSRAVMRTRERNSRNIHTSPPDDSHSHSRPINFSMLILSTTLTFELHAEMFRELGSLISVSQFILGLLDGLLGDLSPS